MIFCIGQRTRYEQAFAAGAPVLKRGRATGQDDRAYPGGWVWQSAEDAMRFIAINGLFATHDVYGVLADWERDTELGEGEQTRRLVRDAEVVRVT